MEKTKRIKIITIYDPKPNYGNRLQNFAVQTCLNRLGFQTTTIDFQKIRLSRIQHLKVWLMKLSGYRLPGDYWRYVSKKLQKFKEFNRRYISTQKISAVNEIGEADYFVLGSDQVWNPTWYDNCELKKDLFLLTFARPEQKVCFSPSFSVEQLPDEWIPWFQKWLPTFPYLGTREDAGAKIIKELTGKDAVVTIDPTLTLDREDWMKIAARPEKVDCSGKYILTYFLGGRNGQMDADLENYAETIGATGIYHMNDIAYPELYVADPSEFLYLIDHAALVVTDSFHACVFSFLFGKPFLCYDRAGKQPSMNSRMETLFAKFGLQRKYINSGLENDLLECDYANGYRALKTEREKLTMFLKKSMGMDPA